MERRNRRVGVAMIFALVMVVAQSCYYDNEEELYPFANESCDTLSVITYSNKIEAIIQNNCAVSGCHTGVSPTGGLFLDTYAQVKAIAENGDLTDRTIVQQDMPPSSPLSNCEMEAIQEWVNNNSPEQ